jgi:hypothetical protein
MTKKTAATKPVSAPNTGKRPRSAQTEPSPDMAVTKSATAETGRRRRADKFGWRPGEFTVS